MKVTFRSVLVAPKLIKNLISMRALQTICAAVEIKNNVSIVLQMKVVATARPVGKCFVLNLDQSLALDS